MTIFLYGAYGTGNLGDDLLLKGALLDNRGKDVAIVAYGKPFIGGVDKYIEHFDFIKNTSKYLKDGDVLNFAGGGLFWAKTHCDDMLSVAKFAISVGCVVKISRIGAQGFQCNIPAVKELFSLSNDSSVRDYNSVEILNQYEITDNVYYQPDYALTLNEYAKSICNYNNLNVKKKIGVNHSATLFYHDFEHRKKALHIYSHIAEKYDGQVDFYYIPHTRHFNCIDQNDVLYGEHFWQASKGKITPILFPSSIDKLIEIYSNMDGIIGWRYHLLVLGVLLGVKPAFLGDIGGHKYGAFSRENNIPQIDFSLNTNQIIQSYSRWINNIIAE